MDDKWIIFDKLLKEDETKDIHTLETLECSHKTTSRMTNERVCCMECGLIIYEPMMTKACYHLMNKKIKKELAQEKRKNKELKYKNIKSKEDMYKSLIEFLGKEKLYLFYKSKVERLFFFLYS
jgi:hypothetical protein